MVKMTLMKKYQFIEVNELQSGIKYDGVELKRKRPYMVIVPKIKQGYFLAVPLTSLTDKNSNAKSLDSNYWLTYDFKKTSIIKLDQLVLFKKNELGKCIFKTNFYLRKNLHKKVDKLYLEFFKISV